jgi:MoaA/NifB/PqqE/SkfB family radical SAM enzyme
MLAPRGWPFPSLVGVEFTNKCNQDCVFCYSRVEAAEWTLEPLYRVESMLNKGVFVALGGREEFLVHPQWREAIEWLKAREVPYFLVTNGVLMTPEVLQVLNTSTLAHLNVSVNSFTPHIHRALTRRESYPQMMGNIYSLFGSTRPYTVSLSTVLTPINYHEAVEFTKTAIELGANGVRLLQPCKHPSYDPEPFTPPIDQINLLNAAAQLPEIVSGKVWLRAFYPATYSKACVAPWSQFWIDLNGDVRCCCWSPVTVGNIKEQGWEEIWNGEGYKRFKASIEDGSMVNCVNCGEFQQE